MPPSTVKYPRVVLISPREQEDGGFGCGFEIEESTGHCIVKKVDEGGSADEAGIVVGERILAVSEQEAESPHRRNPRHATCSAPARGFGFVCASNGYA